MIIGLCGKKHSGKTTIADYLAERHEFTIADFSQPIRLMEKAFLRYLNMDEKQIERLLDGEARDTEIVPELGWRTSRYFQQTLGTDWGRDIMHENIWTNALVTSGVLKDSNVVVKNVRFLDEAHCVRKHGGYIVGIYRPGDKEKDKHRSETELSKIDCNFSIINDSTVDKLFVEIDKIRALLVTNERRFA
jgi:dephospho-CoA kinase